MKKSDMIEILVDEFGLEEKELKDMGYKEIKDLLSSKMKEFENEKEALLQKLEEGKKQKTVKRQRLEADIKRDELVPVINYFHGRLVYEGSDGRLYDFAEFGARDEIPFGELIKIKSRLPYYMTDPYLFIDDEQVVEALKLTELYKTIVHPDELSNVLYGSFEDFKKILDNCPKQTALNIVRLTRDHFNAGMLNDVRFIRFLKMKFDIDFGDI